MPRITTRETPVFARERITNTYSHKRRSQKFSKCAHQCKYKNTRKMGVLPQITLGTIQSKSNHPPPPMTPAEIEANERRLLSWRPFPNPAPRPPPARDPLTGRFSSAHHQQPPPARRGLGPPCNHTIPYYLACDSQALEDNLLPCMKAARASESCVASGAWDPHDADLRGSITSLLDVIGSALRVSDRLPCVGASLGSSSTSPMCGSAAFVQPLHRDVCMRVDPRLAAAQPYVSLCARNYLIVAIGLRPGRANVSESARRIVLWAMFGPAPPYIVRPVAMHTCVGHKDCLQPLHLVWGEKSINASPKKAAQHALNMMRQQRH